VVPPVTPPPVVPPVTLPPVVPPPTVVGTGLNSLMLTMSEDPGSAADRFTVKVDGKTIGLPQTVTALHSAGASQVFDVRGDFGAGPHTAQVQYLKGVVPSSASRLYLQTATFDGLAVQNVAIALQENWCRQFTLPVPPATTQLALSASASPEIALLPKV